MGGDVKDMYRLIRWLSHKQGAKAKPSGSRLTLAPRMKTLRGRLCMLESGAAMTNKSGGWGLGEKQKPLGAG